MIQDNCCPSEELNDLLRHKIYTIFSENLLVFGAKEFSDQLVIPLYHPDELYLDNIILDCIGALELPFELIYQGTALDQYYDYDPNNLLTIAKIADILIDIYLQYHRQLHRFHSLPIDIQEKYYRKIYHIIEEYLPSKSCVFSPDVVINQGKYGICGWPAKRMVMRSAIAMELNQKAIYRYFDRQNLFIFPMRLRDIVLGFSVLMASIINLIFFTMKWVLTGKWEFNRFAGRVEQSLTAKEFADILIHLWLIKEND
ncbi:unnamed protein product [Commensalibacter communis]|uniref:hypothetical protein n=1 Tax=Commensalibacter communis TaxID=2972786 RepID=UPI0022FFB588|nr:hypothetical protein [Commensalibacter communis]CAI3923286.1 unnamed protein product [Commensalibacter communis]